MYTQEQKLKAIELYIKSKLSVRVVISTLGYPSPNMLRNWYRSYLRGEEAQQRKSKYTEEYKQSIIDSYYSNCENITVTAKQNGLPRSTLVDWLQERHISSKPDCISGTDVVKYSDEHKLMAVTEAVCGTEPVFRICAKYGISGTTLDNWRNQLMGIDSSPDMLKDKKKSGLKQHKPSYELQDDELRREYEKLRHEAEEREALLHKVSLKRDVLKVTLQILKK